MAFQNKLFPCGQSRREFVWQMGGGFAGLALGSLLESDDFFTKQATAADTTNPLAARKPHLPSKVKSCIFLMMNGAPSQVDTFDYKPALSKYAGKPLPVGTYYYVIELNDGETPAINGPLTIMR